MGTGITRACNADRERFTDHLSVLYGKGYITDAEEDALREQIMSARSLSVLYSTLSGYPLPEEPVPPAARRRDWSVPENWVPACIATAITGFLTAVVPATALAHRGDTLSNVLTALSIVSGIILVLVAVVVSVIASCRWEDIGASEREKRRSAYKARKRR
jgi:hypothetical protein